MSRSPIMQAQQSYQRPRTASSVRFCSHVSPLPENGQDLFLIQTVQHEDACARQERGINFKTWILGSGSDKRDDAALDMWQDSILLRFVEAVYLIDEQDGALLAELLQFAGILYHFTQVCDACRDGTERDEVGMSLASNHLCQCCFAAAGWPPQNHRGNAVLFNAATQDPPWRQEMLLPENLVQCARTHARRQWFCRCARGC